MRRARDERCKRYPKKVFPFLASRSLLHFGVRGESHPPALIYGLFHSCGGSGEFLRFCERRPREESTHDDAEPGRVTPREYFECLRGGARLAKWKRGPSAGERKNGGEVGR